ncbi:MAG: class I SAM-dependent methyltransferase [Gemmatimonadaceae bacterium]
MGRPLSQPNEAAVTIQEVQRFWEANPLYAGESQFVPGTQQYFDDHLKVTLYEYGGRVPSIFTSGVGPGVAVLDVGCGIGFWLHQFCPLGANVTACDITDRAVQITRRRAELYRFPANVMQGNAERLSFPDSSFDHVNCQGVIHHTPDTAACIREFVRVVRPGGTVCFSVYYRSLLLRSRPLFKLVTFLLGGIVRLRGRGRESMLRAATAEELVRMYDGAENPLGKSYTRADIEAILPKELQLVAVRRFNFPRRVFPFSMPDWLHRILSRWFGLMIVFRCRKVASPRGGR